MKNNLTFKVFLIGLVFLILSGLSFLILDLKKFQNYINSSLIEESSTRGERVLLVEEDLDLAIEEIEVELMDSEIKILESKKPAYKIYASRPEDRKDLSIKTEGRQIKFEDGGMENRAYQVEIFLPKDKLVSLDYQGLNGSLESKVDLASLSISLANANLDLSGDKAYPTDIELINGSLDMVFKNYASNFDVEVLSGNLDFFGEKVTSSGPGRLVKKKHESSLAGDDISIEILAGNVSIRQASPSN